MISTTLHLSFKVPANPLRKNPYSSTGSPFLLALRAHAILLVLCRHCCVLLEIFYLAVCLNGHVPEGEVHCFLCWFRTPLSVSHTHWGTTGKHVIEPMWRWLIHASDPSLCLACPGQESQVLEAVSNLRGGSVSSVILQLPSIPACVRELLLLDYFEKGPLTSFVTCNPSTPVLPQSMWRLNCR